MKFRLLDLGRIEYDEGFPLAGGGVSTASEPSPLAARRTVAIIGALIEHPKIGPVLFDAGAPPNFKELWPPIVQELFAITSYEPEHHLDAALEAAGYGSRTSRRSSSPTCTSTTPAASSSSGAGTSRSTSKATSCAMRSTAWPPARTWGRTSPTTLTSHSTGSPWTATRSSCSKAFTCTACPVIRRHSRVFG